MEDNTTVLLLIAILIIGVLLVLVITLTKKGTKQLDVNKYRSKWLTIEQQLHKDQPTSYQMCVLNADKLVDQALKERGLKGETMGHRMKNAQSLWSNANAVWAAHKLRNQIAHEPDMQSTYDQSRRALTSFKQALKDLGAI